VSARTLGILGVVLAGLVGLDLRVGRAPGPETGAREPVLGAESVAASSLSVAAGADELRLDREPDGGWVDPRGASAPARDEFVDALLSALATTPRGRSVRLVGAPETYGLGAGSIRIVLSTNGGEVGLRLGDVTPLGDSVYARDDRDGNDEAFLVPRGLRALLVEAVTRWSRVDDS
jgi:hypothetical protein